MSEHAEGCGSRTDFCELCNKRVMLKNMEEHRANKCDQGKVDDTIDITGYKRPGNLYAQQGAGGYPMYQSVNFSTGNSHPFMPLLFGHAHLSSSPLQPPPPPAAYEAPPTSLDKSLHVDPQWLASVADVCGEENLDQVLAQNMMIQYSAAATQSDSRLAGDYGRAEDFHPHTGGRLHRILPIQLLNCRGNHKSKNSISYI